MSYIILNGIKSTTVKGLLISSLPPISKPLMRTQIEEIDGRDGDIVTKLGYSAYDKEITIGLYGDFNIDNVIAYFDGEGTVIFSNEADKYYYYQILDQIDYEKLIRFRTATVTLHCQPFKYSAVEIPMSKTSIGTSGEMSISNTGNTTAKPNITIHGNGTINLSVNGYQLFVINLGNEEYITLDAAQMEAYQGDILKNRLVTGDFDELELKVGQNTISWTGNVTQVEVANYSRWI